MKFTHHIQLVFVIHKETKEHIVQKIYCVFHFVSWEELLITGSMFRGGARLNVLLFIVYAWDARGCSKFGRMRHPIVSLLCLLQAWQSCRHACAAPSRSRHACAPRKIRKFVLSRLSAPRHACAALVRFRHACARDPQETMTGSTRSVTSHPKM